MGLNRVRDTETFFFKFVHPVSPFIFAVLSIPSFNFLSGYFCFSLNLVAVPTV